ncbi:hypothetical protein [Rugamonas sp.]|uniref:hypothetical protein n=1 Tax=Rugamonas sp. TaxID=1926287 RepID=UPI0025F8CFC3|nr:hypothetical protein [Rugamonas sp.]
MAHFSATWRWTAVAAVAAAAKKSFFTDLSETGSAWPPGVVGGALRAHVENLLFRLLFSSISFCFFLLSLKLRLNLQVCKRPARPSSKP